jgi:hypothetical protein
VIAGDSVILVRDGENLIDVVNKHQGQGVLNLLAMDGVAEQVEAAVQLLRAGQAEELAGAVVAAR